MTTVSTQASDDDFDRVEQGIDWLERLEGIRAQRDKDAAIAETIRYVDRLRQAVVALAGDGSSHQLASTFGPGIAELVDGVRDGDITDPWNEFLLPALLP